MRNVSQPRIYFYLMCFHNLLKQILFTSKSLNKYHKSSSVQWQSFFAKTTATQEVTEMNGNNCLACLGHLGQQDTNSIGSICACHPGWPRQIKTLLPLISSTADVVSVSAEKTFAFIYACSICSCFYTVIYKKLPSQATENALCVLTHNLPGLNASQKK